MGTRKVFAIVVDFTAINIIPAVHFAEQHPLWLFPAETLKQMALTPTTEKTRLSGTLETPNNQKHKGLIMIKEQGQQEISNKSFNH